MSYSQNSRPMKSKCFVLNHSLAGWLPFSALMLALVCFSAPNCRADDGSQNGTGKNLVPLPLKLPQPAFRGTPTDLKVGPNVEPLSDKPRPALMVPPGLQNLALGKTVTTSAPGASAGMLAKVVDGVKDADDDSIIILRKGTQWVQVDLGSEAEIYAIVFWHAHNAPKVYHDVIVQVSDDPKFAAGVKTLFNNDIDNSSGLGVGTDREYFETYQGKLIDAKGVKARYARLYSNGSTESVLNEYTEVEVWGRPAK